MKSILKNSNGNAVGIGGKLFTVSANYTDQIKQALIDKGVASEDTQVYDSVVYLGKLDTIDNYVELTNAEAEQLIKELESKQNEIHTEE